MQTTTKKVKEGTKGQKQIVTENRETLAFYRNMAVITTVSYIIGMLIFSSFRTTDILLTIFAVIQYVGCYQFMVHMSKPKYSESGNLIDSGIDLNMVGGVAEHVKDVIILTSGCQVLSLYSNYFWLLWLSVPARAGWILWKDVLAPYFFQKPTSNPEMDEKKQKKLERRMRRQQNR
ncbi:UNVERIFIED_CONTAM: hypothetical protein PYX00_001211 [Menopon gallinae]|uniref:Transmembrane protein 208 n=1 Tax=Menopon gallinae TaxID=328185 RepID=A0AAW2IC14_9NEOP